MPLSTCTSVRLWATAAVSLMVIGIAAACSSSDGGSGAPGVDGGGGAETNGPGADASDAGGNDTSTPNDASSDAADTGSTDAGDPASGKCTLQFTFSNFAGSNLATSTPANVGGNLTPFFAPLQDCTAVTTRGGAMRFNPTASSTLSGDVGSGGPYLDYTEAVAGGTSIWISSSGTVKIDSTVGKTVHFSFTDIPMSPSAMGLNKATGTFTVSGGGAATLP